MMQVAQQWLQKMWQTVLDWLIPPTCPSCETITTTDIGFCSPCWTRLRFSEETCCQRCGYPFDFLRCDMNNLQDLDRHNAMLCAQCLNKPPIFEKARWVMAYDTHSRHMILRFKHGDQTRLSKAFGHLMFMKLLHLPRPDLILPVPLHWTRLFLRQYNQATLLAKHLAKRATIRYAPLVLYRKKSTPSQQGKNYSERKKNVRNVFQVSDPQKDTVKNKRVLLVDDVYTTGATVNACARALKVAGAFEVHVITLARVVKAQPVGL